MKLLLDTHAFIWWDSDPDQLPAAARLACEDENNVVCVSVASLWEMQIKSQLGKLRLRTPLNELVRDQTENGISFLPVQIASVLKLSDLPDSHRDPFDRLIIAQALLEGAAIVSADRLFEKYPIKILW
jgi:PIN domain nuclease of toxin-antitoxin system